MGWSEESTPLASEDYCTLSMLSSDLIIPTLLLMTLTVVLASDAKTTHWPKPQRTDKPQQAESSEVGGSRKFGHIVNTTPSSPSNSLYTEETTDLLMDAYTLSPTNSSVYQGDPFPNDIYPGAISPHHPGNYSLDYNECFFNFCECCPPEKGPVGPAGERGPQGPPGERGLPGSPGEKGEIGSPGSAGLPGARGPNGSKGEKGDQGPVSPPGVPGIPGKSGEKGDLGPKGDKGERGFSGMKGDPGEKGQPGMNGTKGSIGPIGPPGVIGTKGQKGEQGFTGECFLGPKGEKGDVGDRGLPGPQGDMGPPGSNGTDGAKGERGPSGVKGDAGVRGPPGLRGLAGMRGERGAKGARGPRGPKGFPGESLEQARSAFSVGLFPSRSFPPPGLPVKFDKVFYNGEGHWDPTVHKFNITYSGVYVLTYHITVRNRPLRAALVVNGVRKTRTRDSLYGQDIDQASNFVLLQLSEGDQVWLETLRDWNGVYSSTEDDSTFSGFLLYPVSNTNTVNVSAVVELPK